MIEQINEGDGRVDISEVVRDVAAVEAARIVGEVEPGDRLAEQIGDQRDPLMEKINERLDGVGELLDLLQNRPGELAEKLSQVDPHVVEADLRRAAETWRVGIS